LGNISEERYATLSLSLESEQRSLKAQVPEMENEVNISAAEEEDLQRFIEKVRRVTRMTELTPELVHEFIEKIVVSKPGYRDGKRYQTIDIYYNGVGVIREPSPEEMERYFNEHMTRKARKTA
jgi:site-specific DNA recombinase